MTKSVDDVRKAMKPFFDERKEIDKIGLSDAMKSLEAEGGVISSIGGNCPVQIEGTFLDYSFYFRARHDEWQFHVYPIKGKLFDDDIFLHEVEYGDDDFSAGWMPQGEAVAFCVAAIKKFKEDYKP